MKRLTILISITISLTSCNKKEAPSDDSSSNTNSSQAGSSKQEEIANKIMNSMEEFTTAISKVSDTNTAKAAADKINTIGDRFSSYAEELKKLDPLGEKMRNEINRKMDARDAEMNKIMKSEVQQTIQFLNPDAQKVMEDAFQTFYEKMKVAESEFERHFEAGD